MNQLPAFEFTGGTEFTVNAVHVKTGEKRTFYYDNAKNTLRAEDGFIFGQDSPDTGYVANVVPFSKDVPIKKSRKVRILKIQLGLSCNYSCDYCSQRFVERAPETSKKDIDAFLKKLDNLDITEEQGLKIELWGGEPLVYWKTIKPLVEALQQRFSGWKRKPVFSMITNGSILTPEICYWLMTNDFSVAISHDGPGQPTRGPDPFDDPVQKKIILDFYRVMKSMGRISFNSMLTASNTSRKAIHEWFVEMTGDRNVGHGEGSLVDAYDDGGKANLLSTKAQHFAFRKQAFNDIYSTNGEVNFIGILDKIDGFTNSVLNRKPSHNLGQKCGMDLPDTLAVDLRGNVLTCQNVSAVEIAPNGESHKAGNLEDFDNVELKTATHWRNRPHCAACPVLHLCKGSCMFIEGENWTATCDNAYSDNIALFALSFEKMTGGFVPVFISGGDLPLERRDIWGDILPHEEKPKRKPFPVKVVAQNKVSVNDVEVFTKAS